MKRIFDFVVSTFFSILLLPLFLIVAFLVRSKLGSPVLFVQERPGLHGKIFKLYKFRTMTNSCDTNGVPLSDSQRLTSFGKLLRSTSLDEIPSLINVIKGDMSLVGPRPLLIQYLPLYNKRQSIRHNIKPGITGWAQVNGRNAISWSQKFELDAWYVENQSFFLDIKILFLTLKKVFIKEGISAKGHVTIEPFNGNDDD
ncbi:TPA: sugar transferase [Vibrio cholerae]